MKWTLTIEGVDLGVLIPKVEDLKPHDGPLEQAAREVVGGLIHDLLNLKLTQKFDACLEEDPVIKEALLESLRNDAAIVQHLLQNFSLTLEDDHAQS